MGNNLIIGLEECEIAPRNGAISKMLPLADKYHTYESLLQSAAFKDLIISNLDDEYLIDSLLSDSGSDSLLKSFDFFQVVSDEEKQKLSLEILNMNNCAQAGVNMKLGEVLSTLERNLNISSTSKPMQLMESFLRRLIVYKCLHSALEHEKKLSFNEETNLNISSVVLNSAAFPEVLALSAMSGFGLNMLKIFSSILNQNNLQNESLQVAISQFCDEIISIENKAFFPSWAPRKKALISQIPIDYDRMIFLDNNKPQAASKSNLSLQSWVCEGGTFDVILDTPSSISSIMMSWLPSLSPFSSSTNEKLGVPEWVSISVRTSGSSHFEEIGLVFPEQEKIKQCSWSQYYPINKQKIIHIRLSLSKRVIPSSTSSSCIIYQFSAFPENSKSKHVDVQQLLIDAHQSLTKLALARTVDPEMLTKLWRSSFSIMRSASSLHLILNFLELCAVLDSEQMAISEPILIESAALLKAMHDESVSLTEKFNHQFCAIFDKLENAKFDDSTLSEGFGVDKNGRRVVADAVESSAVGYAILSEIFEDGVFEWELEFINPADVSVGVVVNGTKGELQNIMRYSWLVPSDGSILRAKGDICNKKVAKFLSGSRCVFKYDTDTKFLSFSLDNISYGVVFETTEKVSPIIIFRSSTSTETREISLVRISKAESVNNSHVPLLTAPTSFETVHLAKGIWHALAELSKIHLIWLNQKRSASYLLEHPYCVEVSIPVLLQLSNALRRNLSDSNCLVDILTVLDLHFAILSDTRLPIKRLHEYLIDSQSVSTESNSLELSKLSFQDLKECVMALLNSEDGPVQVQAVKTFCHGIDLFLPRGMERLETLVELLSDYKVNKDDTGKYFIMEMIFERLRNIKQSVEVCELYVQDEQAVVLEFIRSALEMIAFEESSRIKSDTWIKQSSLVKMATESICKLSEVLISLVIDDEKSKHRKRRSETLLIYFYDHISIQSVNLLSIMFDNKLLSEYDKDLVLKESFFGKALFPIAHSLCMPGFPQELISECLAHLVNVCSALSPSVLQFNSCKEARQLLSMSMRANGKVSADFRSGGWRPIKAFFDDADSAFTISDNGVVFTSTQSTNTCAVANVGFGVGQRAAWEFLLETDSSSDECSVFGAARKPVTSRCYSSSQDLWMRRSYNGYMYAQGVTTGRNLEKIHQGDLVRIEFDGDAGTLSYSINGSELEIGFTNITDEVYPACGSYRNNVSIRLLKVEVFELSTDNIGDDVYYECRPSTDVTWVCPSPDVLLHDGIECDKFIHPSSKDKVKNPNETKKWFTGKGSKGCFFGVHEWAFEFLEAPTGEFCLGLIAGNVAGDVAISEKSCLSSTCVGRNFAFAWTSSGSLFVNGRKIRDEYGLDCFPFQIGTVVRMQVNVYEQTMMFNVNGRSQGVAVDSSIFEVRKFFNMLSPQYLCFPAASMRKIGTLIRLKSSGIAGSTIVPFSMTSLYSFSCIIGQASLRLLSTPRVEIEESILLPWLQSPLFIAGISDNITTMHRIGLFNEETFLLLDEAFLPFHANKEEMKEQPVDILLEFIQFNNATSVPSEPIVKFVDWLQSQDPEPAGLRKMLEKNGTFRFLQCELPFIACLIKQAGLDKEFYSIVDKLSRNEEIPMCTADMSLVWQKTKQLRSYLRIQRQKLNASSAPLENSPIETTLESADSSSTGAPKIKLEQEGMTSIFKPKDIFPVYLNGIIWPFGECGAPVETMKNELSFIVYSIGFDDTRKIAVVEAEVRTSNRSAELSVSILDSAKFTCNECAFTDVNIVVHKKQQSRIVFSFIFYVTNEIACLSPSSKIACEVSISSEIFVKMSTTNTVLKTDATLNLFEDLCRKIAKKSQFLFFMNVPESSTQFSSRGKLLGLSSMYSQRSFGHNDKSADILRLKTQDRWRRVVQYLHVHSTLKRQISGSGESDTYLGPPPQVLQRQPSLTFQDPPVTNDNDNDPLEISDELGTESISSAQATIQACGVFITSEDLNWSADSLASVIAQRLVRANNRIRALNLIGQLLSLEVNEYDPIAPFFVTVFLQNFLVEKVEDKKHDKKFIATKRRKIVHYLSMLEGCPAHVLSLVQESFSGAYKSMTKAFSNMVMCWDEPTQRSRYRWEYFIDRQQRIQAPMDESLTMFTAVNIIRLWTLHFSGRDVSWIHDSGILPLLHKLNSFQFYEKHANDWRKSAENLISIALTVDKEIFKGKYKIMPQKLVENGLSNTSLKGRELLVHVFLSAMATLTNEELQELRISESILANLSNVDNVTSIANLLFCHASLMISDKPDKNESKNKRKPSSSEVTMVEVSEELKQCGLFDSNRKAARIILSEENRILTFTGNNDRIAVMAFGNVPFERSSVAINGNYFEITILQLGAGDIGIGLSSSAISLTSQMPGWQEHSYGYHGDDGKKFGVGKTRGDWPLFVVGDVIGCGIDYADNAIFFTRNGTLLGTAFENVMDEPLYPVVGFSNRNLLTCSVKINCGIEPFAYVSPYIHVNHFAEIERLKREAALEAAAELRLTSMLVSSDNAAATDETITNLEEKEPMNPLLLAMADFKEKDTKMKELQLIRNLANSLLQYLLFTLCKLGQDRSNSFSSSLLSADFDKVEKPLLIKDVSTFGTPRLETSYLATHINTAMIAGMCHEMIVGAEYLYQFEKSYSKPRKSTAEIENELLNHGLQRESSLEAVAIILEPTEVNTILHASLLNISLLCATSLSAKTTLSQSNILRALFRILECSGCTAQLVAISILRSILPHMDPARVDDSISTESMANVDRLDSGSDQMDGKRKARRLPDYLIRILFSHIAATLDPMKNVPDLLSSSEEFPHGMGSILSSIGHSKVRLIQALFEAPLWTEIISYSIVYALKNADHLFQETSDLHSYIHSRQTYMLACAAASCLSSSSFLLPGSLVQTSEGTQCYLISTSPNSSQKAVVQVANMRDFSYTKHIEMVDQGQIAPINSTFAVDFANLSQPLISHLLSLVKSSISWISYRMASPETVTLAEFSPEDFFRIRLCHLLYNATSCLLRTQPDVIIDAIQEADIIHLLGSFSALFQPMECLCSFTRLQEYWLICQRKCLEGYGITVGARSRRASSIVDNSQSFSASSIVDDGCFYGQGQKVFEISATSRLFRDQIVKDFAASHSITEEKSLRILESTEMNWADAEVMLLNYSDENDMIGSTWLRSTSFVPQEESPSICDENVVRGIEYATTTLNERTPSKRDLLFASWLLEPISAADNVDLPFLAVQSMDEGKLLLDADLIGTCRKIFTKDALVEYASVDKGTKIMKTIPINHLRKLKEWYGVSPKYIPLQAPKIDFGMCLVSVRQIVCQLLGTSGAHSSQLFSEHTKGVNVLKLATSAWSKDTAEETLLTMIDGFASPQMRSLSFAAATELEDEFGESAFVQAIVDDASTMLDSICSTSLVKRPTLTTDNSNNGFRVSSLHPFVCTSQEKVGKILIPVTWAAAIVKFHPKCRTPSSDAKLQFFVGTEDFVSATPTHTFYGSNFTEFSVACGSALYYKFIAPVGCDRMPLGVTVAMGDAKWDSVNKIASLKTTAPLGLGDDDTLFNLFNDGMDESVTGVVIANCAPITSGTWRFETEVKTLGSSLGKSAVGFVSDAFVREVDMTNCTSHPHENSLLFYSDGSIWYQGNQVMIPEVGSWEIGDIISVIVSFQSTSTLFLVGRNDNWYYIRRETPIMIGLKPALLLAQNLSASINFGEDTFRSHHWEQFKGELSDGVVKSCHENQDDLTYKENAWGYDFIVKPVPDLDIIITNDFDLIWSSKSDEGGMNKQGEPSKKFWVWRPRTKKNYYPLGDIITTIPHPPPRAILLSKAQAKHPTSYACVFNSSKASFAVWRPKPPENYVCLGDVVTMSFSGSTAPSSSALVCVPKWATKACPIVNRIVIFKKLGDPKNHTNPSLWGLDNEFGFFRGSPYEKRSSDAPRHESFKFNGVGEGYSLLMNVSSQILADWTTESTVCSQPSLPWVSTVFSALLHSHKWRHVVLKDSIFKSIVKYLKTSTAVTPIKMVPILIQMVRHSYKEGILLPLGEVKNLCVVILNEAISMIQSNKKADIPKSLMSLVDLVVEIQAVLVFESGKKERVSRSRTAVFMRMQKEMAEGKEEDDEDEGGGSLIEEKEDDDHYLFSSPLGSPIPPYRNVVGIVSSTTLPSTKLPFWWLRPPVEPVELKVNRVIRKDNLEGLFSKESILLKLKQALKFLHAINRRDAHEPVEENFTISYPKLMTSKIWYEFVSRSAYVESFHPYRERSYAKRIYFPAAQHLTVSFDKRTSLSPGDTLTLSVPNGITVEIVGPIVTEDALKEIQFATDELFVCFKATSSLVDNATGVSALAPVNEYREWGWGLLIAATGNIFETATLSIDLQEEIDLMEESRAQEKVEDPSLTTHLEGGERNKSSRKWNLDDGFGSDSDTGSEESGPTTTLDLPFVCRPPLMKLRPEEKALFDPIASSISPAESDGSQLVVDNETRDNNTTDEVVSVAVEGDMQSGVDEDSSGALDTSGIIDSIGSPRPKSSRGKRSSPMSLQLISLETSPSGLEPTSTASASAGLVIEPAAIRRYGPEPEKDIVVQQGYLVKRGMIKVPYATSLDVTIERMTPVSDDTPSEEKKEEEKLGDIKVEPRDTYKTDSVGNHEQSQDFTGNRTKIQYTYVLLTRSTKSEEATAHLLNPNSSAKLSVPGATMYYQLWALETEELQAILKPPSAIVETAGEAASNDTSYNNEVTLQTQENAPADDFTVIGTQEELLPSATPSAAPLPTTADDSTSDNTPLLSLSESSLQPLLPPAVAADLSIVSSEPHVSEVDLTMAFGGLPGGGWSCQLCTLINEDSDDICAVCGTRRITPTTAVTASDPELGDVEDEQIAMEGSAGWWCSVCTLINPLHEATCGACGTARPTATSTIGTEASETVGESTVEEATTPVTATGAAGGEAENVRPMTPAPPSTASGVSSSASTTNGGAAASTSVGSGNNLSAKNRMEPTFDELKITAVGKMTHQARFETRLEAALLQKCFVLTPLQTHYRAAQWTKDCDDALLEYLNNPANAQTAKSDINPLNFTLPKSFLAYRGAVLSRFNVLDIIVRMHMIEAFNKTLEHLLPLVDLSNEDPLSLGAMIRKSNRYLLLKLKQPLLKKAITATEVPSGGEVPVSMVLSNFKALLSRENNETDPTTSQNCFCQAFHQLRKKDSVVYRHANERVFTITFSDESGIDAGGVFREGMSRIVEDLFSVYFHLLLLCPSGFETDLQPNTNLDKFVPNPKHNGPLALEMFEFIGKLMATSIRAKLCLPFAFPPLIWKKLVGDDVTPYDLMEVDMISFKQLDEIEHCDVDAHDLVTDEEGFLRRFENKLTFTYLGSDKEIHEACPGGRSQLVTFANRLEYIHLVRQARLNEFDLQIEAMARGMAQVIPARVLLLFSAAQMEELVCGSPVIDIDLWEEMTDASSISPQTLKLFWQVMRKLSVSEQSGFIRFAWGRSRLPTRKEDFVTKMRLTNGGRAAMPVSHTCFFSIELPEYRTEAEMRHGLLTAIYYGVGGILNG